MIDPYICYQWWANLYGSMLYEKPLSWIEDEIIQGREQAGSHRSTSTADHCPALRFIINKSTSSKDELLGPAFMDLTANFDLVPRQRQWNKLNNSFINKSLLFVTKQLYDQSTA